MYNKKSSIVSVSIHVLSCIAILLIPLIASPRASIFDLQGFDSPEIRGLISSALLILCFYLNYYYLIPRFFQRKQYLLWGIITFFCFFVVLLLPVLIIPDINPPHHFYSDFAPFDSSSFFPHHKPEHEHSILGGFQLAETILKFLIVYALSLLLRTNEWWRKSQEEKRKAELLSLKSQVNPHFLFNTLNGIYALALDKSEKTASTIIKLSDMMRYNISEIQQDKVTLVKEINYLKDYIDLQKMRLENTVEVQFKISDIDENVLIAPLMLIPFVENAFKYGVSSTRRSTIYFELKYHKGEVSFVAKNDKAVINNKDMKNETGINNVKRRLELTYPDSYQLKITETEQIYHVELKIKTQ